MQSEAFQRLYPQEFYARFIAEGVRPDGRPLGRPRPVSIGLNSIKTANSSALVKVGQLGMTRVQSQLCLAARSAHRCCTVPACASLPAAQQWVCVYIPATTISYMSIVIKSDHVADWQRHRARMHQAGDDAADGSSPCGGAGADHGGADAHVLAAHAARAAVAHSTGAAAAAAAGTF